MGKTDTLNYYNEKASEFVAGTADVNFSEIQDCFLNYLEHGAMILDFGCGSGRDAKYFLGKGYDVEASDGSEELCRLASEFTGLQVKHMLFNDLDVENKYDGIWACASILHLPLKELKPVMLKITKALKENGILYTSFKYSEFEGERNGRYFTDMTEEKVNRLLDELGGFSIERMWLTADVRPGKEDEKWLNLILRKR